jgi:hypothetical protein
MGPNPGASRGSEARFGPNWVSGGPFGLRINPPRLRMKKAAAVQNAYNRGVSISVGS